MSKKTSKAKQMAERTIAQRQRQISEQERRLQEAVEAFRAQKAKVEDLKRELAEDQGRYQNALAAHVRSVTAATRSKAVRLATKYSIPLENESTHYGAGYDMKYYVACPLWIEEDDDPLQDGHYAYDWQEVLWLVEFYAKHHQEHPEYVEREHLEAAPHI